MRGTGDIAVVIGGCAEQRAAQFIFRPEETNEVIEFMVPLYPEELP